jgi:DNA-binding winged helix-turn-helix (wHTH) protein
MEIRFAQPFEAGLEPSLTSAETSRVSSGTSFGRFVALPTARMLLLEGQPVELGARAFDLLIVLLASRGEIVSKDVIIDYVWPTTTVDESNLRFQMAVLRKALGADRDIIKTIPGRGYLLADSVESDVPTLGTRPLSTFATSAEVSASQRAVRDALCALLRAIGRYPGAIANLEEILSGEMPPISSSEQGTYALA